MDLRKAVRDRWVWGQLALFVLVGVAAPLLPRSINLGSLDRVLNRIDPPFIRWVGGLVIVLGTAIAIWGVRSLGASLTPGTEPLPEAPLVTTGAYAYSRHPIYLGVVLVLTGYTLAWSNWTLALVVGIAALAFFEAKARVEERWLMQRHPVYATYMRQVRRRVI
jgi:protein-S-isoprenylcysteine O-methyltransferase Ste14